MPMIPLLCPICGKRIEINSEHDAALCRLCGTPFIVKDAIVKNYISLVTTTGLNDLKEKVDDIGAVEIEKEGHGSGTVAAEEDTADEDLCAEIFDEEEEIFAIEDGSLWKYRGEESHVIIPDTVTEIYKDAFRGCDSIRTVQIPNSVQSIGWGAFQDCTRLTDISIPKSVTNIGPYAFQGCTQLKRVAIANGVTYLSNEMFEGCSRLSEVLIPDSVTAIKWGVFSDCVSLHNITIPDGVTVIEPYAFKGCAGLTDVTIPNSVKSIGEGAFIECTALKSISIPEGVTSIGTCAFVYCSKLQRIDIPASVTSIGESAFDGCTDRIFMSRWKKEFLSAFSRKQKKHLMECYNICPVCGSTSGFSVFGKCKNCEYKVKDYSAY